MHGMVFTYWMKCMAFWGKPKQTTGSRWSVKLELVESTLLLGLLV